MSLTVRGVEAAKPRDKAYKLADSAGLYLFVSPAGGKSWRADYLPARRQMMVWWADWLAGQCGV